MTPLIRPPAVEAGEDAERWLARARRVAEIAPLGHHTHWGGPTQARPVDGIDAAAVVHDEIEWLRAHGLRPKSFCGGGWYMDEAVAEALAAAGYVDCSATTFRPPYLDERAPRLQLSGPRRVRLPSGASLLELPATHSVGMLARAFARLDGFVHLHFHDWELVDRRRALAVSALLRALRLRRRPLALAQLAELAAGAEEIAWPGATIDT